MSAHHTFYFQRAQNVEEEIMMSSTPCLQTFETSILEKHDF